VQLYGVDPATMHVAVRRLVDEFGADHVDLNFGCPVPKVTRKGGGAALPVHHVLFRRVVAAAVDAAGAVPVTVKMRIGVSDAWRTFVDAGRAAEDVGVAAVALHARTAEQAYSGAADWSAIGELKTVVTTIPVLGNGDIWEADDALGMMAATGCDGVVVGRGCLGRPWLFGELADAFAGRSPRTPPTLGEVAAIMRRHARLLGDAAGATNGIRDFRKHASWYLTGFPVGGEIRRRLAMVASLDELDRLLDELDPAIAFPPGAGRLPRGHTHGPKAVALPHGWLDTVDDPTPPPGAELLVSGG
jgi:nifR3 family TIM-barrel protein